MENNKKIAIIQKVRYLNAHHEKFFILGKRFVFAMYSPVNNTTLATAFATDGQFIYDLRHNSNIKNVKRIEQKYSGDDFPYDQYYQYLNLNYIVVDEVVNGHQNLASLFDSNDKITTYPKDKIYSYLNYIEVVNKKGTIRYPVLHANGKQNRKIDKYLKVDN